MSRLQQIAERRGRLLARIARDRVEVAEALSPLTGAIAVVDRGWALARWLRARPWLVGGAVALAVAARPRRALRAARLGVGAWQTWRWASAALRTAAERAQDDKPASRWAA